MIKKLTVYKSFEGERFNSLNDANNHEERLKDEAIRALCNHHYDKWKDYMLTRYKETN